MPTVARSSGDICPAMMVSTVPVADEPLTTRATREALARLDAEPNRLLS